MVGINWEWSETINTDIDSDIDSYRANTELYTIFTKLMHAVPATTTRAECALHTQTDRQSLERDRLAVPKGLITQQWGSLLCDLKPWTYTMYLGLPLATLVYH